MRLMRLAIVGIALTFTTVGAVEVYAAEKNATRTTKSKSKLKGVVGTTGGGVVQPGVMELTSQECKGLGGTINDASPDMNCKAGEQACYTTDKHGVIRGACIDEVAAD